MIAVPASMLLSRRPWYEAFIKRLTARWLRRHDPQTLALASDLKTKLADQSSWLDRIFPPPDDPQDAP